MFGRSKKGVVLLLLVAILVLTILPTFDLKPTRLRAARHGALLFIAIAAAASGAAEIKAPFHLKPGSSQPLHATGPDLLDLTCTRLC